MDLNNAIAGRRSVRDYTSQGVDEKVIANLIDSAVHAPSAVNEQPWTFTVVRDQSVLDRLSQDAKSHMLSTTPAGGHSDHFASLLGSFNSLLMPLFRHKFIVLHAGMLSKEVSRQEVKWMIARFVGSLKAKSCRLSLIQAMIAASEKFVIFNLLFYPYERAVVLSGDRLGLGVVGGDLRSAMTAMNRLCVGVHCGPYLSSHGMLRQSEELRGIFAFLVRMLSKHPPLPRRYEALLTFAREAYPREFAEFTGTTAREPAPRLSGFNPVAEAAE